MDARLVSNAISQNSFAPPVDFTSLPIFSPTPDNARAAVVGDFAGHVIATSDGDELSAFRGLALLRRDSLETGAESWSSLELNEEQYVLIEENSDVLISQLADDAKSAELTIIDGKIWVNIEKKLADDESFEIRTPTCALSVRGTVFAVTFNDNSCQVAVYAGTVSLHAEDESGSPILDGNGDEVYMEISGDKAKVTVENGTVTHVLQTGLTEEDWTPLYVQGGAGPGGMFDILRSRLPGLVWDDDTSPFAAYEYYARELRSFLDSGKSGYSIMLKDIDRDDAEELVIYWEDAVSIPDEYPERIYRIDIYDWDSGEELHSTQEKLGYYGHAWDETLYLSDTGNLAFYRHASDITPHPGWVYHRSKMYSIGGCIYEPGYDDNPTFDGNEITGERFAELCSEYGLELYLYEDDSMRIVSYEPKESAFPYADTQTDIQRLLPDYVAH